MGRGLSAIQLRLLAREHSDGQSNPKESSESGHSSVEVREKCADLLLYLNAPVINYWRRTRSGVVRRIAFFLLIIVALAASNAVARGMEFLTFDELRSLANSPEPPLTKQLVSISC